jgi:hypothetical protein
MLQQGIAAGSTCCNSPPWQRRTLNSPYRWTLPRSGSGLLVPRVSLIPKDLKPATRLIPACISSTHNACTNGT